MTKIVILGAGEHGRTIARKSQVLNYEVLGFLDDTKAAGETINGVEVLGGFELALGGDFDDDVLFHVAIGDPAIRVAESRRLKKHNRKLATIIHPRAQIEEPCDIGEGVYVTYFSVIGINSIVEDFVNVHAFVLVSSDASLQTGSTVSPRCVISRGARIGRETFVGTGAIILPDVSVGARCVIGAGSLVTKDIPDNCTAYGSPSRIVRDNS